VVKLLKSGTVFECVLIDMNMPTNDPAKAKAFFEQKLAFTLGPIEIRYLWEEQQAFNFVDVRDAEDYREAHALGAISLPEAHWEGCGGLSKDRMNVLYGYSGVCSLAARAAVRFAEKGFPVMEMDGGFEAWEDHELEIEPNDLNHAA
jgi:rhodanese-related sulfurtransferase